MLSPFIFYGELLCCGAMYSTAILFVAEGDDWVDAGGADCGNGAGGGGDAEQNDGNGQECAPVVGIYGVEQRAHQAREEEAGYYAGQDSERSGCEGFAQDQAQNVGALCAHGYADADLARSLH